MDADLKNVGARVRAARIQGNYKRRPDLSAVVPLPHFGEKLLGQIERGERPLYEHEAEALARVLPVPSAAWFYEDGDGMVVASTGEQVEDVRVEFRGYVAEILKRLEAAEGERAGMRTEIATQNANLKTQTEVLERIVAAEKTIAQSLEDQATIATALDALLRRLEDAGRSQRQAGGEA